MKKSPNCGEKTPAALPFSLEGTGLGRVHDAELICPGVYFIAAKGDQAGPRFPSEYLAVLEDSPAISPEARAYGTPVPAVPGLLLYPYEYGNKGRHIVEYEAHRYLVEHRLPLPENCSLDRDRAFGREVCPEYFGEFLPPAETPWGRPLGCERLWNGLYWLETPADGWVLAVAYPLWSDLWEDTLNLGSLMADDREKGAEAACGCYFFPYQASCLVLYEMIWAESGTWEAKINRAALQNAVLEFFPDYRAGGGQSGPLLEEEEQIPFTPGAGTEFYLFPSKK